MNKTVLFALILFVGVSPQAFAGTGYANDHFQFVIVLAGFLILIAGLLNVIDFINKNGKRLIAQSVNYLNTKFLILNKYFKKSKSDYIDISGY